MDAKLVIADDDPGVIELLQYTLENEGAKVITAVDGENALTLVREHRPDLVILDVTMPRLSGFEVCERIREDSTLCLTPVILLTSLSRTSDRITGIKLGADEYLNKPFEPLELVARVENLLKRNREAIAANPLTGLPGNVTIETEMRRRISEGKNFAVLYTDIDHFKSYNDKYGFEKGDGVIRLTAMILRAAVSELGTKNDFTGHIGGDDFVIITDKERMPGIAEKALRAFDNAIPQQYDEATRERGTLEGMDRQGRPATFPMMTLSMGGVVADKGTYGHYSQLAEKAKDLLKLAKQQPGSTVVTG